MAQIPPLKIACFETKNTIFIDNQSFLLTNHKCKDTEILYLGGSYTYCINIQIMLEGSIYERFGDITTCLLDHLYYSNLCSLSGGFQRNVDVQKIFRIILSYIKKNYKYITKIKLKDYSTRECIDKSSINLYELYYILHGKTWYQSKYNAYLMPNDEKKFEEYHKRFQAIKKTMDWNTMKQFIYGAEIPDFAEKYYNETDTWQDFFTKLKDKMDIADFSVFIRPWISTFLSSVMKYDFTAPFYYINIQDIPSMNYKQEGGYNKKSRYTRKRRLFAPIES
jgi:hypothetical protein